MQVDLTSRGLLAVTLAGLFSFCGTAKADGIPAGATWDWQLQAPLDLEVAVDVLVTDPDEVTEAEVAALVARGVTPVCYVSVGTWEEWRGDAGLFPADLIGAAYDDWPGERFLDIRAQDRLLPRMAARFRRCAAMGFQAIEPDNIDVHINATGFDLSAGDVVAYMRALAGLAHGLDLLIAQKNAPDLTEALSGFTDFAITENCLADDWCADMVIYPQTGRAVLATEYRRASAGDCAHGASLGLSLIFKRRDLTAWRQVCPS